MFGKLFLAAVVVLSSFSSQVNAYYTGKDLGNDCKKYIAVQNPRGKNFSNVDFLDAGVCMGFVRGFFGGHITLLQAANIEAINAGKMKPEEASLFNDTKDFNYGKKVDYIVNIMDTLEKTNQQALELPAESILIQNLIQDFPNKERKK